MGSEEYLSEKLQKRIDALRHHFSSNKKDVDAVRALIRCTRIKERLEKRLKEKN